MSVFDFLFLYCKVASSAEGAAYLLEAGVAERLAESDNMARASQMAAQASKLGALGANISNVSLLGGVGVGVGGGGVVGAAYDGWLW